MVTEFIMGREIVLLVPSNVYGNQIRDAVYGFIRLLDSEVRLIAKESQYVYVSSRNSVRFG